MITVYGISNCDTVKKALNWLDTKKVPYRFHNYKTEGISKEKLKEWIKQVGWPTVLNNKSSTYRQLLQSGIKEPSDKLSVINLLQEHTSIIKRPIFQKDGMLIVGFNIPELEKLIN